MRASFAGTLASEWTKLTTLRSTHVTIAMAGVLAAGAAALAGLAVGVTWDDWSAADREDFSPVLFPLVGGIFAGILLPILGVKAVTSEYGSGMIRLTLTATPRRGRVLLAKAGAVAGITLVGGTIATFGMFFAGQAVFAAYGLDTASLAETDTLRAVVGVSVLWPVFPVIGVALAFLTRSAVGAITTVLGLIFAPGIFGTLLPEWWQDHIVRYLPGPATDGIAISHLDDANTLNPGVAVAVLAAWLAAFLGAAYVALTKRDA
jgi:ABC-2 type transport system permease protein